MPLPVRLIAVDIDGTLIDSTLDVPEANLQALRRAQAASVQIVLVTGRRHRFAMPVAEQLGFEFCLISSNGAMARSAEGEVFHRDLLPRATAHRLCQDMLAYCGNLVLTFDTETKGALVLERTDEMQGSISRWLEKNMDYIEFVSPIEQSLTRDPIQAMFCGPVARMTDAQETLRSSKVFADVTVLRTQYDHRDLCIVDVLNRGCSKGHAVERWMRSRGFSREQVMAIGDNYNDVEMLEIAGVPVIMGNACAELKQNGWQVTQTNDEAGVARAIEQFIA